MLDLLTVVGLALILGIIGGSMVLRFKINGTVNDRPHRPPLKDSHYRAHRVRKETEKLKDDLVKDEKEAEREAYQRYIDLKMWKG